MLDLDLKVRLFKEYLENGGYEKIPSVELCDSLMKVKGDSNGKVIPETVDSHVRAAMNAYVASQLMQPLTSPFYLSEYESFLQKDIFFNQRNIETKQDLESFILDYSNKQNLIYRGVREARWRLYSSLQRHWIVNKYAEKKIDHKAFIIDLLKNSRSAFRETLPSFLAKNNIDPGNDMAILSFIQHHGQPTPLLDWTEDLASALYFAIEGIDLTLGRREVHQYFSVYILGGDLFSRYGIKKHMEKKIKSYSPKLRKGLEKYARHKGVASDTYDKMFSDDIMKKMTVFMIGNKFASGLTNVEFLYNLPFAFFSDSMDDLLKFGINNNMRITNQRGVFTWNSDPVLPLEHVILNTTKADSKSDEDLWVCSCININKNLAEDAHEFLDQNGIDKDYIYPDPERLAKQSFSQTLRNQELDK
jgi:hypothetical protein